MKPIGGSTNEHAYLYLKIKGDNMNIINGIPCCTNCSKQLVDVPIDEGVVVNGSWFCSIGCNTEFNHGTDPLSYLMKVCNGEIQ